MHFGVYSHSYQGNQNESKEHLDHSEEGRFIVDIFSCSLVYEFKHFMGCDVAVGVTDTPFELLQIHLFLDLAHHCHMWFGYDQVGCTLEAKSLIDGHSLHTMCNLCKEGRISVGINRSHILIEIN